MTSILVQISTQLKLLTDAVAPFPIPIIVGCDSAPSTAVASSCAAVVTTAFVNERKHTAMSACGSSLAISCFKERE